MRASDSPPPVRLPPDLLSRLMRRVAALLSLGAVLWVAGCGDTQQAPVDHSAAKATWNLLREHSVRDLVG